MRALAHLSWETVPAEMRAALDRFQRRHLVRMLALSEELCRVAEGFAAQGIAFAAFKGATLAAGVYGDLTAREYNDIDVVVPEQRMDAAEEVLAGLGYRGVHGDRPFRRAFFAYQRQFAFLREGLDTTLDLHWAFCGSHLPFPLAPADLWPALVPVQIGRCQIPTAAPLHLALLLAGHGTKESWRSLGWVNDFAMLVQRHPELDWAEVHRLAADHGCGNAVLLGCLMAEGLLGVAVPSPLVGKIEASARMRARAASLMAHLREGQPLPEKLADLSDIDLCDSRRDRLKAVLRLAVTRTAGDYEAMRLPQPLWGAYRVMRPFRLAAKALGHLARSASRARQ
ncbi:MAG: nucleotidyltransferase family protein [Alphaproteobacteria bacterium]|nr:nucleotidyltransferase family protein [Alphaproteobacteria bacterium]